MVERFKNAIRYVLFYTTTGDFIATKGTLKYRFLDWLYGDGVPEFPVLWPDEEEVTPPPQAETQKGRK